MRHFVFLLLVVTVGCGAREEVVVSQLDLARKGWDTLQVSVSFANKTLFGGVKTTREDSTSIIAFNASYDTLYVGSDSVFAIVDADLGNGEKVLVEVCGDIKLLRVCEQISTFASPKRIQLEPEIKYPLRKKVFEGEYKLPFVVERFEDDRWKRINPSSTLQGYMKAYVEGREEEFIRLPFARSRGGFNLAHHSNYKDFKFYLDSSLLDEEAAHVVFDVYVDLEGFSEAVGSISKAIEVKSDEEHKQDVALFVEKAANEIVDELSPFLRRQRNTVYIDNWTYNKFKKMYTVDMEVEWRGTLFNRIQYRLSGILEVYEDGERAIFKYVDGNRRTSQRWESQVDGNVMTLYTDRDLAARQAYGAKGPFREVDGMIVIEAEHFKGSRPYNNQSWRTRTDRRGFRGEGAVVVAPDKGVRVRSRYNKRSPELTYPVEFQDAGKYYIWLRTWAGDNNSNSAHIGLNGDAIRSASYLGTENGSENYGRWIWTQKQLDRGNDAYVRISSPGVHNLNLWMREDGFYIDRIILTKDRFFIPRDGGPAESPR